MNRSSHRRTPSFLKQSCLSVLIAFALNGTHAVAQTPDASIQYAVPAGDLVQVINQISRSSGVQIVYDIELLRGRRGAAVSGAMTVAQALDRALAGSELSWTRVTPTTITIQEAGSETKAPVSDGKPTAVPRTRSRAGARAEVAELDKVVVVGSRLGSTPSESALPITVITRDEIERSGASSIAQMLSYMSEVSVNGSSNGSIGSVGGNLGLSGRDTNATSVQLRGLPLGTTLILINGRRSGESSSLMQSGQFDLSTIPLAMVERIEVLPAGASAVYGGDGLAGVVNIVLRRDANGIGARLRYAHADGHSEKQASVLLGKSWSRGSVTLSVTGKKGEGLEGAQRRLLANTDFTRFGGRDLRSSTTVYPGNVYSLDGCPPSPALCFLPVEQRGNLPGLDSPFAGIPLGQDGNSLSPQDFLNTAGTLNRSSQNVQLISPETSKGLTFNGHFDLTSDTQLIGELMYNRRSVPASQLPFQTADGSYGFDSGVVGADNPFNPFGVPVAVDYWYRDTGVYRDYSQTFWRAMVGARGKLKRWEWEATSWRSRDTSDTGNVYAFVSNRFASVLNASDPARALNPFSGDGTAPGSRDLLMSLVSRTKTQFGAAVTGVNAYAQGPLFKLPAGQVEALLGVEYQKQQLISKMGIYDESALDYSPVENVSGPNYSHALFAEVRVPILAGKAEGPGKLVATGAFRLESTGRIAEKARTETLGLEYRPIPSLLVRGMYSTAFKPLPIYSVAQETLASEYQYSVQDPKMGGATFMVKPISGGGLPPNLQPETSKTRSLGVVLSPSADWRFSLSAWNTELDDLLYMSSLFLPFQFFMDHEDELAGRVIRDPASGVPVSIDMRPFNVNAVRLSGADVAANGRWQTGYGEFNVGLSATYTHDYRQKLTAVSKEENHLGVIHQAGWAPRWKIVPRLEWFHRDASISLLGRYVSTYEDPRPLLSGPRAGQKQQLGDFWMFDTNIELPIGRYLGWGSKGDFLAGARLGLGARNLFNRLPDFCNDCSLGYDASQYDIVGRTAYVELRFGF
ncbi:TonB-dependent receptor domain-containing protein [Luteimonas sp. 22616]|uniref:TonB-dependent receptor domain-containing protein n=1 Tax=Luteimonas sp. 22616 TaxID=3453951 RepID=UPI003F87F40A